MPARHGSGGQRETREEVAKIAYIPRDTYRDRTAAKRQAHEEQQKQRIYDLWMSCYTQEAIGEDVGLPRQTVADKIAAFAESGDSADSSIFGKDFDLQIYQVWNFAKSTNEVKHPGNVPSEYHTVGSANAASIPARRAPPWSSRAVEPALLTALRPYGARGTWSMSTVPSE